MKNTNTILSLLFMLYSAQSFPSDDILFNLHNNTDHDPISIGVLSQLTNKLRSCSLLDDTETFSFKKNFYQNYCREPALGNGKIRTDLNGEWLYYSNCQFLVYASKTCDGNRIGAITLDRGTSTGRYVNEATIKNISKLAIKIRNDADIYNNKTTKGYVLLQSRNAEHIDISVQNTVYYMINNKSKAFVTKDINKPCELGGEIKYANILSGGNSISSIPSVWLYDKCRSLGSCSIYINEVIKPRGQNNGTCGNIIGIIHLDLENKNDPQIDLYDNNYQLSIQPYLKTSFKARKVIVITENKND